MSNRLQHAKVIGIYKAFGWQTKQIIGFYLKAYLFSGSIGVAIGAFLGIPLAYYIGSVNSKALGNFELSAASPIISALSAVFFVLVLMLNVFTVLRRVGKITPVQAISMGMASSKEKFNSSLVKNASSSFSMAVNDIVKKRGMSLMISLVLCISFYLVVLFSAADVTLADYKNDAVHWLNMPAYDSVIAICGDEKDEVENYLENSDLVEKYVFTALSPSRIGVSCGSNPDIDINSVHLLVHSEISEEKTDTICTKGRIPSNSDEVSISVSFQRSSGLDVGDYIELHTANGGSTYLITGIYSTMLQGGSSITMSGANYEKLGFTTEYEYALVFQKDGVDIETLKADFNKLGLKSDVLKKFSFMDSEGDTINSISSPVCILLIVIFVLFSLLNIINLMLTTNLENRRRYGILKAMGFTNGYIRRQIIFKMIMLSSVAVVFTAIIHRFVSPMIFSIACGVNYIMDTPVLNTLVIIGMFALILLTALAFTIPLRKISPKDLMEE